MKFTENSGDAEEERVVPLPDDQDLTKWNFVYLHHDEDASKSVGIYK